MIEQTQLQLGEPAVARVPRKFVFPVVASGPVKIEVATLAGERYDLLVGGVAPLGGRDNMTKPGLTMGHARLIYRMLYGRSFDSPTVPLNFNDLIRNGSDQSGRAYELVRKRLNELEATWMHIIRPGRNPEAVRFMNFNSELGYRKGVRPTDIKEISQDTAIGFRRLKNVVFAPEFWRACLNFQECWAVRLDAIDSMTSDFAAFCYLTLAPKTFHKDVPPGKRMSVDATKLVASAGMNAEAKWRVRETFERQRGAARSVLQQMDGVALWDGVFRVSTELKENSAGTGYNVVFWREVESRPAVEERNRNMGALYDVWVRVTHRPRGFYEAQRSDWATLEPHNIEAMEQIGYRWEPHQKFLEKVRSFIGPVRFDAVLGSVKMKLNDVASGSGTAVHDIGRYIGGAMISEFEAWAKKYDEQLRGQS